MARRSARERGITLSAPASTWASLLVLAATQFWLGVLALAPDGRMGAWFGWLCLCLGCASTARAWKLGMLRVSMTSDAVTVRGLRRRTIAWQDIRPSGASANTPSQNWVAARTSSQAHVDAGAESVVPLSRALLRAMGGTYRASPRCVPDRGVAPGPS